VLSWSSSRILKNLPCYELPLTHNFCMNHLHLTSSKIKSLFLLLCSCKEVTKKARRNRSARVFHRLWTRPSHIRHRFRLAYAQQVVIPCENSVPSVEAVNDFVGLVGRKVGLIPLLRIPLSERNPESGTKSSAEGSARDVKNFRGCPFCRCTASRTTGLLVHFLLGKQKKMDTDANYVYILHSSSNV
jgi:hypothetical protein